MARNDVTWRVDFNHYPRLTRRMVTQADTIVTRTAMELEGQMKVRAPVDTGFLRSSIQATRVGRAHWRVVVGADYGIFQEYGTVRNRPRPFFHPAIRQVRPRFRDAMRRIWEAGQ